MRSIAIEVNSIIPRYHSIMAFCHTKQIVLNLTLDAYANNRPTQQITSKMNWFPLEIPLMNSCKILSLILPDFNLVTKMRWFENKNCKTNP